MRNLKRALSLALAAMMLIGMMVVSAGAATKDFTDADEITHPEAVNTLVALNVIAGKGDGSAFDPTGTLTRAEMAKLVTYVLNGGVEPVLGTKVTPTYSDIKGHWAEAYIEYCTSMYIIVGDGTGKFNPEGTLTASQCAKMLLTAMNYKDDVFGFTGNSWEINVNREANAAGLYKELGSIQASQPISRDNAAQMVYNAIQAKTMRLSWQQDMTTGQITQVYNLTGESLFEDKFGGERTVLTFAGDSYVNSSLKEGQLKLTGAYTVNETARTNATITYTLDNGNEWIGEKVEVLWKDSTTKGTKNMLDKEDTIYGMYPNGETSVLNVTSNDISDNTYTTAGKIKVDGSEYEVVTPAVGDVLIVKDFGAQTPVTAEAATAANAKDKFDDLSKQNGDTVKFILNDDNKVEKAYVQTYQLGTVTAVNSEKVTISGLGSIKIADNEVYDGIAKNDVVVYSKLYNSTLADAYVIVTKAESVSGTVTGYKTTENVTLDGTVYKIYNKTTMLDPVAGETGKPSFGSGDIGESFTLYLVNGYVRGAVQTSETANNYSLVIDKNSGDASSSLSPLKLVVLGADGTKTTLTVSDKSAVKAASGYTIGDIVTYTGSADNAKVTIEKGVSTASGNATTTGYDKTSKTFNGIVTAANAVLFRCTDQAVSGSMTNAGTYKAYNIRDMKDFDVSANKYTYLTNDDGMVVAVFIGLDDTISTSTSDAVIGIVSANNGVVEFDDDEYNQYVVVSNDKSYTVNIEDGDSNDTLKKGDVVAFAPTSDDLYSDNTGFVVLSAAAAYTNQGKTIDGSSYTVSTVYVKNYDESEGLLTYYTSKGTADGDGAYTDPSGITTKAVADDVVIVYVDVDNDAAGDQIGVNGFDAMTGYANAIVLENTEHVITHIVIETSNEYDVFAQNP